MHQAKREYIYPVARNRLAVHLQAPCQSLQKCTMVFWNRFYPKQKSRQDLECIGRDGTLDYFITELIFLESSKYLQYFFELKVSGGIVYFSRDGQSHEPPQSFFEYLSTAERDVYNTPEWAHGAVWYQIFPDRFHNSLHDNNPADYVSWGNLPTRENHFGGNLSGILEKLPYLQGLGIQVIYLTPVFLSPSNHKYDTKDYYQIDPAFGTEQDLIKLVESCHEIGIRVVLDGVFNHCGYEFAPFQDVLKNGADSPYANWFYIDNFPVHSDPLNYECVGYYKLMPKLRYDNPEVRKYFLDVGRFWIRRAKIDGWRLDVADEVDFTFWQEFRQAIKAENPNALLLAETWKSGSDLLRGDQMDSVMNYLFRDACISFFAQGTIDAATFDARIQRILHNTPVPLQQVMYNLLGSHDTPRLATLCGEDSRKIQLAVAFQMIFPGMPVVYYGDEIGLLGENDPDCRRSMNWDNADNDLHAFFKQMIELRRNSPAICNGDYRTILCDGSVYGFTRRCKDEVIYAVINNSTETRDITVPIIEGIETILSIECPISGKTYKPKLFEGGIQAFNRDIYQYSSYFTTVLPGYCFEIINIRRKEE
ncbi:MAG: glycoside hydrolase family 13 protein [Treponema sp.]|nr:glycoside hydrolase family 13 protein [Treponema sp.]